MRWLNKQLCGGFVILFSLVLFSIYQAWPVVVDPDGFYHARLAAIMLQQGIVENLPWLPFTTLAQQYADQHLLYHIFLLPLVSLAGPLLGTKISQVLLATAFTWTCFAILRRWQVPHAGVAVLALYSCYPMLVRINLLKASALALIIFLWLLVACLERRYVWAAVLTILYSLTHGGFFLAGLIALITWLVQIRQFGYKPTVLFVVGVSMILGVIINPYYPANLDFLWAQFFQIGVINYQEIIAVGAEWYPFALPDLIGVLSIILIGLVAFIGTVIILRYRFWLEDRIMCLVGLVIPLFLLTLRSRRFVEYLVPILWLLVCVAILPAWHSGDLWQKSQTALARLGRWQTVVNIYLALAIVFSSILPYFKFIGELNRQPQQDRFMKVAAYMKKNIAAGEIIYHADWDKFPELFYYDPTHRYIAGLDPTFLYLNNKELYQQWVDISSGKSKASSAKDIQKYFLSRYVIIDETNESTKLLLAYLLRDPQAETLLVDNQLRLFKLQP